MDPKQTFADDTEIDDEFEIEVEDDTPPEDRDRGTMPKEIVEDLEADELEDYSGAVKERLKQLKRVWHDERREKERAQREHQEAINMAKRFLDDNKRLRQTLSQGEQTLVSTAEQAAKLEAASAGRAYQEAYDAGDSGALLDAQNKLQEANIKLHQIRSYQPSLQYTEDEVVLPPEQQVVPQLDDRTRAWQERNTWWGVDEEMTASALGLHQKLFNQYGDKYVGTDEYWSRIDATMRQRFPESFDGEPQTEKQATRSERPVPRTTTVVASASRSTSPKRIRLRQSQLDVAKRLGLTPEQYAKSLADLEASGG